MRRNWHVLTDRDAPWYIRVAGIICLLGAAVVGWIALDDSFALIALVYVWTFGSALGILAEVLMVRATWGEYRSLFERQHRRDEAMTLIAEANFRRESFRLMEFMAIFGIGANVLLGISNVAFSRSMIVVMVVLLIGNTLLDYRERRKTQEILKRIIREERQHRPA